MAVPNYTTIYTMLCTESTIIKTGLRCMCAAVSAGCMVFRTSRAHHNQGMQGHTYTHSEQ